MEIELDQEKLYCDVCNQIVRQFTGDWDSRIQSDLEAIVREEVREAARPRIAAAVDKDLKAGVEQTNRYGEPIPGKPRLTLVELIVTTAREYLDEKVDPRYGDGRNYSGTRVPRIRWLVAKAVEQHLESKLVTAIDEAVEAIPDTIAKRVNVAVKDALRKAGK